MTCIWLAKDFYIAYYKSRTEGCQNVCNYTKWGRTRGFKEPVIIYVEARGGKKEGGSTFFQIG